MAQELSKKVTDAIIKLAKKKKPIKKKNYENKTKTDEEKDIEDQEAIWEHVNRYNLEEEAAIEADYYRRWKSKC